MRARMAVSLLVVIMVAAAASTVLQAAQLDPQVHTLANLLQEINTWNVVEGLNLSRAQMEALLPIAREVRAEHEAVEAERLRSVPEFECGIRMLRTELLANNGVSEEAKAAVAQAEAGWKQIEIHAAELVPQRVETVFKVLTPEQEQFVAEYRPGAGPRALARVEQLLLLARRATPRQFNHFIQRAQVGGRQHSPEVAAAVRDIATQARAMTDAEFQAHKSQLARRLLDALPHPQGERPQQRDLYARVRDTLLNPSVSTTLEAKLGIAPPGPLRPPAAFPEELQSLVTDVRVLNLVNSLYLTQQQMKTLSDVIARADAARDADKSQTEALLSDLIAVGAEVRTQLAAGGLAPETEARALTLMTQAAQHKRRSDARMAGYVNQVKGVLDDNQLVLVSEFIPCLIPVRSLTNPERIGQAQDTEGAERLLSHVRRLPESQLPLVIARAQERLRTIMLHLHMPTAEISQRMADIPRVIDEARAMSETEFEVKRTELVKRVLPPERAAATGKALDQRIATYLLCPNLLPIFAQRTAS